jgi:hypothetical protein
MDNFLPVNYSREMSSPENERYLLFIPDNSGGDYYDSAAYLGIPIELTIEIKDNLGYTASFSTNVTIPDVFGSIQLMNFNYSYSPTNHELEFDFDFSNTSSNRFWINILETSLKHYKFGFEVIPRGEQSRYLAVMLNSSKDFANTIYNTSHYIEANTTSSFTNVKPTIKTSFSSLQDIFDFVDVDRISMSTYRMDLTAKVTLCNSIILKYGRYYKRINNEIDVTRTLFGYMVYPHVSEQGAQPSFTPTFYSNTADFFLPTPFTFPHFDASSRWSDLNTNDHHYVYDGSDDRYRVPPSGQSEPWWDDLTIGFTAGNYPIFSATIKLWRNFSANSQYGSGSEGTPAASGNSELVGFSLSYPSYTYSTPIPSFNIHLNTTDYNSLESLIQVTSRTYDNTLYYRAGEPVWEEYYFKVEVVQTTTTGLTKTYTFDTSSNFDFWPTNWIDSYFTLQSS